MLHIFRKCHHVTRFAKGGELERGAASIFIELGNSNITVYHGTDKDTLLEIKKAPAGSWDKIWRALRSIKGKKMTIGGVVSNKSGWIIGDILKAKKSDFYVCVYDLGDKGVGTFVCDKDGVGLPESGSSWVMYSWDYDWKNWEKVGHRKLEHVTKKEGDKTYSFHKSGNDKIDTYLSLLDDRYDFFKDNAPKNLQTKFDSLENDNYHFTSAQLVEDFFNHPTWKHLKNHRLVLEDGGEV